MQAHENRIRQLLDSTQQFIVPLFQRFYVWETPCWETIWDDLNDLIEDDDPNRSHFIGAVVVIPAVDTASSLTKFILIDGQQRLATILVLLAAAMNVLLDITALSIANRAIKPKSGPEKGIQL